MRYAAADLAVGWLTVACASEKNDGTPILDRTVYLERFPEGVRLVATNARVLFTAWVPDADHAHTPEPMLAELPASTAIAYDPDGRARGLLAHLLKLARTEEHRGLEVDLLLNVPLDRDHQSANPTFEGLEALAVTIQHADRERLQLTTIEGRFPNFRQTLASLTPRKATSVVLSTDALARVVKAAKIRKGLIRWEWCGEEKPARVEVVRGVQSDDDDEIGGVDMWGAVMPSLWDVETNRPIKIVDADDLADDIQSFLNRSEPEDKDEE